MRPRPILSRRCNLFCYSYVKKHIVFSFNKRTRFTLHCISVVIFVFKANNNVQILKTVRDIVEYHVSDFISQEIRIIDKASVSPVSNTGTVSF